MPVGTDAPVSGPLSLSLSLYIYIYIYIYARPRYSCPVSWTARCTAEAPRRLWCACMAYLDCMDARDHGVIHVYQDMRVLPAGAWERGGADAGRSSLGPLDCVPPCPSAVQTSVEQDSDMRRPQAALLVMTAGAFHVLPRVSTRR